MILSTIEQIILILPSLDDAFEYKDFQTYIEQTEEWLKNEILGIALYNTLNGAAEPGDNDAILKITRRFIANGMYQVAIPFIDVAHTTTGVGVVNNQTLAPASQQRVAKLVAGAQSQKNYAAEDLVTYLFNTTAYHAEWKASEAFAKNFNHLIYSSRDFSRFFELNNNFELYLKIKSDINYVEQEILTNAISWAYLSELITKRINGSLTAADTAIINKLQLALAFYSIKTGIENLSVTIDEKGILRSYKANAADYAAEERLRATRMQYKNRADKIINQVLTTMVDNIDDYETFADSDEYARMTYAGFENEQDSSIFVGPS